MARQILTIGATSYSIVAAPTGGTWEVTGEPNDPADMSGTPGNLLRIQMIPWSATPVFGPTVRFQFPNVTVPRFTPAIKQIRTNLIFGDASPTDGGLVLSTATGTLLQTINNPWVTGVWPAPLSSSVTLLCNGCYADLRFPAGGSIPTGGLGSTGIFLTSVAIDLIGAVGDNTGMTIG